MKRTHIIKWTDKHGHQYSVLADVIAAGALFETLSKSKQVVSVSCKSAK